MTPTPDPPPPVARALLLAGGIGSRLRPLTDTVPKCLVPIGGRPLLDHWIDNLARAGVAEAVVNTHHLPGIVRAHLEAASARTGMVLRESFEPELLGSAGTVTANRDLADGADQVVLVYADNLSDVDLAAMLAFHRAHAHPFTMLLFRAENPRACGIASLDDEGTVVRFTEKPSEPESDLANAGVYVVDADAYREIADLGGFDLGFDVLPRFVGRMAGYDFGGYHRDIGTLAALEAARADVACGRLRTAGA